MAEDEPRVCALELAMCMHWVVDMSTPPHCYSDCDQDLHSKIEDDFDKFYVKEWPAIEGKVQITNPKNEIKDVYRWAKGLIEGSYDRNEALIGAYKNGKTLKDPAVAEMGRAVLKDMGQNVADFLAFADGRIKFENAYESLKEQSALLE
jgi:hypothetical protein